MGNLGAHAAVRMSSYQHLSHAGNHGDVLKHVCFVSCLHEVLKSSVNGVRLLDTHAGAGVYHLGGQTTNEYKDGIQRVFYSDNKPNSVQEYVDIVRSFNGGEDDDELRVFPGSPALGSHLFRPGRDEHVLWELNPSECQYLQSFIDTQSFPSIAVCQDGFANVSSRLEQHDGKHRANFVLIDPPYKTSVEYAKTLETVKQVLATDPQATIMVWVPQLPNKQEAKRLDRELVAVASKSSWIRTSLTVQTSGLLGSTVVTINPPVALFEKLQSTLPWLATILAQDCCDYSLTKSSTM